MKKILLATMMAAMAVTGANAKTADELRIYINPGHGSWTADDRPCTLVGHGAYSRTNTDTLSFFESNTNLQKGLGLLDRLHSYGLKFDATKNQTGERWQIGAARDMSNNLVMSHVKCGPYHDDNGTASQLGDNTPDDIYYYNRLLSEICEEVTANNFDMFISIHSNAATEGTSTNFPLFLYGGYDTPKAGTGYATLERQQLSRAMADACWGYAFANSHMQWTNYSATSKNLRGDMNFYGTTATNGYLGALKHSAPGFLVEGYFHTYQPARHRAMNWDVCRFEADAYAHGIADYFGLTKEKTGAIYGIVRDKNEKFHDAAYAPNPTTPDRFKPLNGVKVNLMKGDQVVRTYTTDNYYNGAFVFRDVEPGDYTLTFESEQYLPTDEPVAVTVKALEAAKPEVYLVDKDWTPPTVIYENYPDTKVPFTYAADEYGFNQSYVDEPVAELDGLDVRHAIAKDNYVYILAHNADKAPTIVVWDAKEKKVAANVSTTGCTGAYSPVGDIAITADGVLVATNETLNHYSNDQVEEGETRGTSYLYRWENDENGLPTGDPVVMGSSQLSANMYRGHVGTALAYSGTLAEGKALLPVYSWYESANHAFFFNLYTVADSKLVAAAFNNGTNQEVSFEKAGSKYQFTTSPLDADKFILTGAAGAPREFEWNNVKTNFATAPAGVAEGSASAAYFRYNGKSYMVVADNATDVNVGAKLIDITDGMDKAAPVSTINTTLPAVAGEAVAANVTHTEDAEGNVTAAFLNLYVVRAGKITHLTTEGFKAEQGHNGFAYALAQTGDDDTYTLSFKLSNDVKGAEVVLTPLDGGEDVVLPVAEATKGEHSVVVNRADLDLNVNYKWAVKVQNKAIPQSGDYFVEPNTVSNIRGGVATFNNPETEAFGTLAVCVAGARGIDIYNPEGVKTSNRIKAGDKMFNNSGNANNSSPMRATNRGNEMLMASWGDTSMGVVALDVTKPESDCYSVFEGTKAKSGLITNDGVSVGSGTPGIGFYEDGENSVMYTFDEDLANNAILRYDIGTAKTWGQAPSANLGFGNQLANTDVSFVATKDGVFAAQNRGAGNNANGCPGFLYASKDGELLFSSHVIEGMNSCNSAIAMSADGSKFAVGEHNAIAVYNLTWNEGKPEFELINKFAINSNGYTDMKFDYAGNLHYYSRLNNGLHSASVASPASEVVTPAKAEYVLVGTGTGVEDIIAGDDSDAPAVYYNLNGVRVSGDNLTPGLYIKVQGKTATKVIVK